MLVIMAHLLDTPQSVCNQSINEVTLVGITFVLVLGESIEHAKYV